MMRLRDTLSAIVVVLVLAQPSWAADAKASIPRNAYFGELHLHTSLSTDAYMNGTRTDLDGAYRFAQGDPVTLLNGQRWQLSRALDFAAITDHAESFGDLALCTTPGSPVCNVPLCQAMRGTDRG